MAAGLAAGRSVEELVAGFAAGTAGALVVEATASRALALSVEVVPRAEPRAVLDGAVGEDSDEAVGIVAGCAAKAAVSRLAAASDEGVTGAGIIGSSGAG